jgi:ubiquinone/menaquinone biosynthesis C-methylase UbiE
LHDRRFFNDEKERRKWQDPESILTSIGLKPGFTFADIGCGVGFFALPAARIVGSKGRVYGLDADEEAIEELRSKAANEGLRNLSLKVGKAEDTVVCCACADIVFFGIVLHDFEDPSKVLSNAKKALKPDGLLVDLDWKKKPMKLGPPPQIRLSQDEAKELIETAGFTVQSSREEGPLHYVIIAAT